MSAGAPRRTVEEHLAGILAAVRLLPVDTTTLAQALGMTLAEPVRAAVDIPVFDNSAMDGFAVHYADVADASAEHPVVLRVVADLPAGAPDDPALARGEAVRIMTGSVAPSAASAIVPFEDTVGGLADSLGEITVVRAPRAPGAHIRRRGEDIAAGAEVLPAGVELGALQLASAAAAGVDRVRVRARPRVLVLSTGTELVPPGQPLQRGQIPESNGTLIAALVAGAGAVVAHRDSVDDEGTRLRAVLAAFATGERAVDAVVFTGGVSAGAYEVVRNELAGTMSFSTVAMQPGKPQGFGVLGEAGPLLFGLPGNPVSAAVSFETYVRPALLAMQGRTRLHRPVLTLPASCGWKTPLGRRQYLPAVIDRSDPAQWTVAPASAGGSGSHLAGGLGSAEAYAVVGAEVDAVAAGDLVDVILLGGLIA